MSNLLFYILITLFLGASALFSGLTLGLMTLSPFELKRKAYLGDKQAELVYPIREKGNQLLVTLLLGNVLVNAVVTVLLNSVQSGLIAVALSTLLITIFGEIVPQAVLKKHGLEFGAKFSPLINWLMLIFSPLSLPLAWVIDKLVGNETPDIYSKDELVKIVEEHEESEYSDIEEDELRIVENALNFGDRLVKDIMTPLQKVQYVNADETVDKKLLAKLHSSGHSRFPVVDANDLNKIIGILYVRDMILLSNKNTLARNVDKDRVYVVKESELLDRVLRKFIATKSHLFIVSNKEKETVGVISIEDILEEIIGEEIIDESDRSH